MELKKSRQEVLNILKDHLVTLVVQEGYTKVILEEDLEKLAELLYSMPIGIPPPGKRSKIEP